MDYKISWKISLEGELINEREQIICIFVKKDSIYAKLIILLPEVYDASQELLSDLSSTKGLTLKRIYNRICDFYDKTSEN